MWRLDLGRSLPDLVQIVADLEQRGVQFESLTEKIETGSAAGKLQFHVFAALAEFERGLIRERTRGLGSGPRPWPIRWPQAETGRQADTPHQGATARPEHLRGRTRLRLRRVTDNDLQALRRCSRATIERT